MSVYSRFLRKMVIPAGSKLAGYDDFMPYLASLEASQWYSPEQIQELQNAKLRRLIRHVYHHTAFYRQVMDERGLTPADIESTDDLVKLPIIDKKVISRHYDAALRDQTIPRQQLIHATSSGSTGEILQYWTTKAQKAKKWAGLYRFWELAGYDFGERYATFTVSANRGFSNHPILSKLEWRMLRHLWLPMIEITDDNLAEYARRIAAFKPVILRSYASTVYFLARYMNRAGVTIHVPAVITTGETLTPYMRETVEKAFAPGRVFNEYGADGMQIAGECDAHSGMHINAETVFVEVVRDGRRVSDGETGELVLTNLEATATPFIRYNIHDVGALTREPCACGRGLPRLTHLEGRLTDLFATHDGRWLSVHHFTGFFGHFPEVDAFQVIQHDVDDVEVKLVTNAGFTARHEQIVREALADYLGEHIGLTLTYVDEIPTTPAGKRRFFISEVIQGTPSDVAADED